MVRLTDLTVTDDVLHEVTFENCTIVGPAVVVLMGCAMIECVFEGPNEALFWPLGDRNYVIGAIGLVNCTLVSCRLQRIGVAYPADQEETYRREFGF